MNDQTIYTYNSEMNVNMKQKKTQKLCNKVRVLLVCYYCKEEIMDDSSKFSCDNVVGVKTENQHQSKQDWPHWLPSDWCIHRNVNSLDTQVHYSNPQGKSFYSEKQILEHLANQAKKKPVTNKTKKRKITKHSEKAEASKLTAEPQQSVALPAQEWPDWLPQDWSLGRSHEDPTRVFYCSPKWKKFESKDEALNHIEVLSKKKFKDSKQPRKKEKKMPQSKDSGVCQK